MKISLIGVFGVFLILLLLSELVRLISKLLPQEKSEPSIVEPSFADLPYFKERNQADLVIIAALMKKIGHQGKLSIKRVN